ncbi:hypothetical protein YPPY46_3375 [Yersinia pestis PY-46]|uniref:Uncharacterized protein n=1 Tax=Yersinia pestis biovar Orientalis str. IP275 TaxID=373665 RepID=A0AAV3B8P6_YERPE|nr:hypothetical protein YPC_1433 [Yersinia pestis biovar Medievalis str. Harbin 35]EDR31466.1 hypothetical protein YPIP275_1656 [Yersinia pestis biovar Orientalis str. IP275]EDR38391.1 hypothetical protein YpF1991016_2094 [Yersinia pestis biovar Orientalis str. F1991016]EDR42117.1 hypothetical protein YpE1979001_0936 [Yersinia pestis biovar Antiqua str. E1979001]EDR50793.1 hypothetical protein YpB42003004_0624 [Yersinia pestis biovar Antiqua str. B42003004]EDR56903.1 hypothetical protein YpMG0
MLLYLREMVSCGWEPLCVIEWLCEVDMSEIVAPVMDIV